MEQTWKLQHVVSYWRLWGSSADETLKCSTQSKQKKTVVIITCQDAHGPACGQFYLPEYFLARKRWLDRYLRSCFKIQRKVCSSGPDFWLGHAVVVKLVTYTIPRFDPYYPTPVSFLKQTTVSNHPSLIPQCQSCWREAGSAPGDCCEQSLHCLCLQASLCTWHYLKLSE